MLNHHNISLTRNSQNLNSYIPKFLTETTTHQQDQKIQRWDNFRQSHCFRGIIMSSMYWKIKKIERYEHLRSASPGIPFRDAHKFGYSPASLWVEYSIILGLYLGSGDSIRLNLVNWLTKSVTVVTWCTTEDSLMPEAAHAILRMMQTFWWIQSAPEVGHTIGRHLPTR